jgi:hypothetical protein
MFHSSAFIILVVIISILGVFVENDIQLWAAVKAESR